MTENHSLGGGRGGGIIILVQLKGTCVSQSGQFNTYWHYNYCQGIPLTPLCRYFRSPTPHDSFSPSTHSSSRRKRKRKSSHSDSKKPQQRSGSPYTPPTSPVNPNEDTPTPRDRPPFCSSPEIKEASMSSAPPKSTDSKRSPTHRLQPVNGAAVASITSTAASPREASTTSATTASTPWSDPGRRTTTNFQVAGAAKPQRLANRFDAACETSQAPVSSSPNALPSNGFHSSVQSALRAGEVPVVPSGNEGRPPAKQPSPPPHQRRGSGVAGGWQRPPCGSPSPPPPSPPPPPSSVPKTTTTTATAWCKVATRYHASDCLFPCWCHLVPCYSANDHLFICSWVWPH